MKVRFTGYTLDAAGFPTFAYEVGDAGKAVRVQDTPKPLKGAVATGVRRSMRVEVPGGQTAWFLAGQAVQEPRAYSATGLMKPQSDEVPARGTRIVLPQDGGRAVVLILANGPSGAAWHFAKRDGGWFAMLRLPEGPAAELDLATWALPRDDEALLATIPK